MSIRSVSIIIDLMLTPPSALTNLTRWPIYGNYATVIKTNLEVGGMQIELGKAPVPVGLPALPEFGSICVWETTTSA